MKCYIFVRVTNSTSEMTQAHEYAALSPLLIVPLGVSPTSIAMFWKAFLEGHISDILLKIIEATGWGKCQISERVRPNS